MRGPRGEDRKEGVGASNQARSDAQGGLREKPRHGIREVDPENRRQLAAVANLHMRLFHDMGPVAQLGELFVREFCYAGLIRDGLIRAAIYEVDGEPAGMVAYTDRSIGFHRSALRRHWLYVGWLVLLSVIRSPRIAFRLPRAFKVMFSRRHEQHVLGEDPMAEVLAVGVLPEYRRPEFVRRTGLCISDELQDHVFNFFRHAGLSQVRLVADADNMAALLYWHRAGGGRFEPYVLGGKPSVQIWLDLTGDDVRGTDDDTP